MITYARIDIQFDIAAAKNEVLQLTENWCSHFNSNHYTGDWKVLPLRSPGGSMASIYADNITNLEFEETVAMGNCTSIKKLLNDMHCPVMSVRLLNLAKGAVIKPHRDAELAFELGEARLHFPIVTNPQVSFFIEDELLKMQVGDCWYINANLTHSAINKGETDRIHLVVDCIVNDWLKEVFASAEKIIKVTDKKQGDLYAVIEELKRQNTDASIALAIEMENNLIVRS